VVIADLLSSGSANWFVIMQIMEFCYTNDQVLMSKPRNPGSKSATSRRCRAGAVGRCSRNGGARIQGGRFVTDIGCDGKARATMR
jgi:energy-converting hydrogenase Eha subunit B